MERDPGLVYPAGLRAPAGTAWCFSMKSRKRCARDLRQVFPTLTDLRVHNYRGGPFIVNDPAQCPKFLSIGSSVHHASFLAQSQIGREGEPHTL